jgi:4-amino-4-deoxy-L-arabinose transferase-like glycosyltransferase
VAVLATAAAGMGLFIAWSILELIPHVTDSVSYLFQGRILASGRLYLPPPAIPPLFAHENILLTPTRWCSKYPPGWPLLLALGWLLHAPWLMSPLLLGLAVVGVWLAGRRLYDPATGVLAAAALASSPFALLMAGDSMSHVPALCLTVWCLAMLAKVRTGEGDTRRAALGAGLLFGGALLIRPLTAVVLLAPAAAWCAAGLARRRRLSVLAWMALGAAPALLALAAYDTVVFGGPLVTGYALAEPARYAHAGAGALAPWRVALGHTLPWYLRHLDGCLWGFPWGDLLIVLPLLWARPRRAADGMGAAWAVDCRLAACAVDCRLAACAVDCMLAACAAGLVLAHCFFYYGDVIYSGPRYAFESLGPLALLAARSLRILHGWLAAGFDRAAARLPRVRPAILRAVRLAVAGGAAALLLYFPLGRRLPAQLVHHAQWYLAQSAAPLRAAVQAGVGPDALVLVAGTPWCYSTFFLENDLGPESGRRVYVRDLPPLRAAALRAYRRAEVWVARVVVEIPDPRSDPDVARLTELSWRRLR